MNTTSIRQIRAVGSVIVQRLGELKIAKSFQARVNVFTHADAAFQKASQEVDTANAARTKASRALHAAAIVVGASVEALADAMVTAKLGKRTKPFVAYSTTTACDFSKGAFANRVDLARKLVSELHANGKLPASVEHACDTTLEAADGLAAAIKAVAPVELAYRKALREREPLTEALLDGLTRFKNAAKVHWEDEPATFEVVFAPPERVMVPVKPRKSKKAPAPTPTAPPASPTPPATTA